MKEENIVTVELNEKIEFDGHDIKIIKFDLEHINRGWDAQKHEYKSGRRSEYTASDVVEFFEQFGFYSIEWEAGENKEEVEIRGQKRWRYISYIWDHDNGEKKRIVIDIPVDFKTEGIIVTIH